MPLIQLPSKVRGYPEIPGCPYKWFADNPRHFYDCCCRSILTGHVPRVTASGRNTGVYRLRQRFLRSLFKSCQTQVRKDVDGLSVRFADTTRLYPSPASDCPIGDPILRPCLYSLAVLSVVKHLGGSATKWELHEIFNTPAFPRVTRAIQSACNYAVECFELSYDESQERYSLTKEAEHPLSYRIKQHPIQQDLWLLTDDKDPSPIPTSMVQPALPAVESDKSEPKNDERKPTPDFSTFYADLFEELERDPNLPPDSVRALCDRHDPPEDKPAPPAADPHSTTDQHLLLNEYDLALILSQEHNAHGALHDLLERHGYRWSSLFRFHYRRNKGQPLVYYYPSVVPRDSNGVPLPLGSQQNQSEVFSLLAKHKPLDSADHRTFFSAMKAVYDRSPLANDCRYEAFGAPGTLCQDNLIYLGPFDPAPDDQPAYSVPAHFIYPPF